MQRLFKILWFMMAISNCAACAQHQAPGFTTVSPAAFAKDIASDSTAYVLDVRTPQEYVEGHIENAHNLDWLDQASFRQGVPSLLKDRTLYVYCRSGRRSAEAATYLSGLGYKVVDLDGGILAWDQYLKNK